MDRMERLVRTWMATGRKEEVESAASGMTLVLDSLFQYLSKCTEILNGDGALLPLIKALGEFLTSQEDNQRSKGVVP